MSITKPTPRKVRVLPNKFKIYEDYVEVVLSNTQNRVLVDIEDFLRIRTYKWRETNNYAHNRVLGYMHRFILNAPKGTDVDHIYFITNWIIENQNYVYVLGHKTI